jgi:hypothetical protein
MAIAGSDGSRTPPPPPSRCEARSVGSSTPGRHAPYSDSSPTHRRNRRVGLHTDAVPRLHGRGKPAARPSGFDHGVPDPGHVPLGLRGRVQVLLAAAGAPDPHGNDGSAGRSDISARPSKHIPNRLVRLHRRDRELVKPDDRRHWHHPGPTRPDRLQPHNTAGLLRVHPFDGGNRQRRRHRDRRRADPRSPPRQPGRRDPPSPLDRRSMTHCPTEGVVARALDRKICRRSPVGFFDLRREPPAGRS